MQEKDCVLCLGFFDGLHLGHQALLRAGLKAAKENGLPLCVHTFDRSPFKQALTTLEERKQLLLDWGAHHVHITVFDESMRQMSGEDFFEKVICREIGARYVICGEDHRFGYKGAWDTEALSAMCRRENMGFEKVAAFCLDGEKVSSTAIRKALQDGDILKAERLLGRAVPEHWKRVIL